MTYGLELSARPLPSGNRASSELDELGASLHQAWPVLRPPVVLAWSDSLVLALDRSEVPWVYGPAERDPYVGMHGGTVLPLRQRARLTKIAELRIPFQRLAIAHELDRTGPVADLLEELEVGPRRCSDELARELVGSAPPHPLVAGTIRALDDALGSAASAISSRISNVVRDPIVFGVIAPTTPSEGQLCLWCPLAAWRW